MHNFQCLPHPQCTLHVRRYKRNLIGSQYCEPCNGHYGRKKREAERDQCLRREKRYADEQCDNDEFSINERSKRQAYNPKGILDIVKMLSKASSGGNNPGGCMKFPACVLAQKKRRKRNADRMDKYYKAVEEHKKKVEEYELAMEEHKRVKRQFFAPDNSAACVPCPAWVTLALASRKKREADDEKNGTTSKQMTISEAIADIRSKKGYKLGFEDDEEEDSSEETIEMRRKQRRSCEQSDDCLNNVEYAVFQKVYAEKRTKREAIFRRKKCTRCGVSGLAPHRVKRNFGGPNINVSEQNCMAFPQCRHRVKRNLFGEDCNICTADSGVKRRRKRNFGTAVSKSETVELSNYFLSAVLSMSRKPILNPAVLSSATNLRVQSNKNFMYIHPMIMTSLINNLFITRFGTNVQFRISKYVRCINIRMM